MVMQDRCKEGATVLHLGVDQYLQGNPPESKGLQKLNLYGKDEP